MGDKKCADSCSQRLQVRRHVRLQRDDHVRAWSGHLRRPQRAPQRLLRPHFVVHPLLHDDHPVLGVCAKGTYIYRHLIGQSGIRLQLLSYSTQHP